MQIITFQSYIIIFIILLLLLLLNLISKKTMMDREKMSPFECGFDPKNLSRLPFSLQFFLIAVIFIIFDVELTLLLPTMIIYKFSSMMNFSTTLILFIIILITGLIHEQNQGALNWVK